MKKTTILLLIIFLATSCHPIFCVWNMGYDRVSELEHEAVVGKYALDAHSKKMMTYEGNFKNILNSILELRKDGTYLISDAPDWLTTEFGESNKNYFDKSGRWNLLCGRETCILELEGLETGELIFKKKDNLYILLSIGDPDSCQGMVYKKL